MRLGIEAGPHTYSAATTHGITGVPVSAEQLVDSGVDKALAPLRERGLQACQIGVFGFNPLSPDGADQKKQRDILTRAIPLAQEAGCRYLVINGGNYHPSGFGGADPRNFTPDALDRVAEVLQPFVSLAEHHGVCLSIEPYLKTAICSPETFLALKQRLPSDALRVNIDVTSLFGFDEVMNPDPAVEHICTALAGHYGLVHIKDISLNDGFHIHMDLGPLGSTATNWSQVLRLVNDHLPADSWVILEHVLTPEEAAVSLGLLRKSAEQAKVILE